MAKRRMFRLAGLVLAAAFPVLLTTAFAGYGDWHIMINTTSTPSGSDCPSMSGQDAIYGTFEWVSGLSFWYSYNTKTHWEQAPYSYDGQYYIFDFTTDWDSESYPWGATFVISARSTGVPEYYCVF